MIKTHLRAFRLVRLFICLMIFILIFTACNNKQKDKINSSDTSDGIITGVNSNKSTNKDERKQNDLSQNNQGDNGTTKDDSETYEKDIYNNDTFEIEFDELESDDIEDDINSEKIDTSEDESFNVDNDILETGSSRTSKCYYVRGDGVRLRERASINSNIIIYLNNGMKVKFIDKEGDWIKVKYEDITGYIREDLLSDSKPHENSDNETIAESAKSADEISNPKIIVKKSDRILELWDGDELFASYPIGLGWNPIGDKKKEGDGRTPEGTYYVCTRNNASRFYLSLGVSYPNKDDAREALDEGLIDQNTYNQIADAIDRKSAPPWYTALGGEIMIHGHGSHSDWTAGCVAVDNEVMDILWASCPIGTPIIIEP